MTTPEQMIRWRVKRAQAVLERARAANPFLDPERLIVFDGPAGGEVVCLDRDGTDFMVYTEPWPGMPEDEDPEDVA